MHLRISAKQFATLNLIRNSLLCAKESELKKVNLN